MQTVFKLFNRWKWPISITLITRIFLFCLGWINFVPNYSYLSWIRWDGPHYVDIATNGYVTTGEQSLWIVFYPLYPLLIKAFSYMFLSIPLSAILVPILFSLLSSIALYELVLLDFKKREALLSVWFLNIFPTSYFLQASYTESLFLFVSIMTFYFFRTERFLYSGFFGFLSGLTRINGITILPALLFEIRNIKKSASTFLIAPLGFITYLLLNHFLYGDFFYFHKPLLTNWYKQFAFPWVGISQLIHSIPTYSNPLFYTFFSEIITIILILFFSIFTFFKIRKSYGIYILVNLLLFTCTSYIMSTPRYMLILFPIYICLSLIKNKYLLVLLSAIFIYLLIFFATIYIRGGWAF